MGFLGSFTDSFVTALTWRPFAAFVLTLPAGRVPEQDHAPRAHLSGVEG